VVVEVGIGSKGVLGIVVVAEVGTGLDGDEGERGGGGKRKGHKFQITSVCICSPVVVGSHCPFVAATLQLSFVKLDTRLIAIFTCGHFDYF
jgi:hypothetical protein